MSLRVGIDAWGQSGGARFTGMGRYTEHLLHRLPDAGVEVVAYGAPDEPRPDRLPAAVEWRAGPGPTSGRWSAITSRQALPAAVERDGIEVFHAPGVHVRPSFPPIPRVRCPITVTVHDLIPITFYGRSLPLRNRAFVRWNLRRAVRADAILTVSSASRAEIAQHFPGAAGRVEVIPNVVDFGYREDDGALARHAVTRPFLFAPGSYEPRKNLRAVIAAFDQVARRDPHTTLVALVDQGSGFEADLREAVASLSHADRVRLVSGVADEDLEVLYSAASAVVFCSLAEGYGLPAAQTIACGTPLVASDLPVIQEVVGDRAVLVDPTSVTAIASGMRTAMSETRGPPCRRSPSARADWAVAHAEHYRRLVRPRQAQRA